FRSAQHAHVIRRDPLHILGGRGDPPEEVAASDHEPDLDAGFGNLGDLGSQLFDALRIDAERCAAGQCFTAQLEQDSVEFGHGLAEEHRQECACARRRACATYDCGGEVSGVSSITAASPTLKRTKRDTEMFSPSFAMALLMRSPTVVPFSLMKGCSYRQTSS